MPTQTSVITNTASGYIPQLDTLRIFAVVMVSFEHWIYFGHWFRTLPFGAMGVTLFFVLSGFLITQILIKSRENNSALNENPFHTIRQFYIRRTLRIFPIYYLTLIILFIINFINIRQKILWYLFYAYNIYYFKTHDLSGPTGHFWTLCVEEQFYLVWPFIILFIPKRYLFTSIILIILTGPFSRFFYTAFINVSPEGVNYFNKLPVGCTDSLGIGALLAYVRYYPFSFKNFKQVYLKVFLILNIISFVGLVFFYNLIINLFSSQHYALLFKQFFLILNISVISVFLINKTVTGFTGFLKIIFENKILRYLGKISYGLYLYHNFIPNLYAYFGLPEVQSFYLRYSLYWIFLILISSVSWFCIEKPVNNLKKYFAYN